MFTPTMYSSGLISPYVESFDVSNRYKYELFGYKMVHNKLKSTLNYPGNWDWKVGHYFEGKTKIQFYVAMCISNRLLLSVMQSSHLLSMLWTLENAYIAMSYVTVSVKTLHVSVFYIVPHKWI